MNPATKLFRGGCQSRNNPHESNATKIEFSCGVNRHVSFSWWPATSTEKEHYQVYQILIMTGKNHENTI
jgi:hypothetical protein